MIRQAKLACLVVGLLTIPIATSAQTRVAPARPVRFPVQMAHPSGVAVAPARTSTVTQPRIIRLPVAPVTQRTGSSSSQITPTPNIAVFPNGTNGFIFPGSTSFDLNQLLNNGAPGFGFDFTHQAALQGNLGEKAFIDPVTQQDIALAEQLARSTPAVAGGFIPLWGGYSEPAVEEEQQQQPQVIVLQQPAPASNAASTSSQETAPTETQTSLPDVGPFTLVLHNGEKIKTIGFTRQNNRIVYITKDGKRDSFAAGDLDVSATEQLNQDHGTPLHLSL